MMQRGNRFTPRARLVVGASTATMLAACTGGPEYPQTTFHPVTEYGEALNSVFANTFWWTMAILVLVCVLVFVAVLRFRERPDTPHPKQIHGNTKLELMWTIIPALIVVLIGIPTVQTIFTTQRRPAEDALTIEVIGHQWWWEFRYPEQNVVTANQFYFPVGREIHLRMHSADVIHSFWVPRLGGKRDVNPLPRTSEGERQRYNHILFTASETGLYSGQCAEFCGDSHGIMSVTGVAVEPAEFDTWVASMQDAAPPAPAVQPAPGDTAAESADETEGTAPTPEGDTAEARFAQAAPSQPVQPGPQPPQQQRGRPLAPDTAGPPLVGSPQQLQQALAGRQPAGDAPMGRLIADGQRLFTTRVCIACHAVAGTTARGIIGPNLTRFGVRPTVGAGALPNTQENVERWIRNPRAVKAGALMPGTREGAAGFPATNLTDQEVRAIAAYLLSLR